jgi:hypothetical protein
MNLKYRVWEEGGLWYWEVLTMRGARLRYGAADRRIAARTEALLSAVDAPARCADQAALEASRLKALREQAHMAWSHAQQAFGVALQAAQRSEWFLVRSEALFSRSRVANSADRYWGSARDKRRKRSAMTPNERLQHATRCRELAKLALTDRQRQCFLKIAHLYERETLLERAAINIAQSRKLLATTERLASSPSADTR